MDLSKTPYTVNDTAWFAIALIAVLAGVWVRFQGLGAWPLAVDEYYIFRSVSFIVETGLPAFPCGGFYERALAYQYVLAPLIAAGVSPGVALRSVAIVCNLLALPAVYLLARALAPRDVGRAAAYAAVAMLALSAWEIEMARFGRMYAPFQAVFIWYLYHSWQLISRQELWRWRWLLGLSFLGLFVWEGWVVMAALNFLPILIGGQYWRRSHLALSAALLSLAQMSTTVSFHFMSEVPALPSEFFERNITGAESRLGRLLSDVLVFSPQGSLLRTVSIVLAMVPLLAIADILRKARPRNPHTYVAVAAIALALALNQIVLAAAMLLGTWLLGWTDQRALGKFGWHGLLTVGIVVTAGWVAFLWAQNVHTLFTLDAIRALAPIYAFPNYKQAVIEPWLYTIPIVSTLLALGLIGGIVYVGRADGRAAQGIRWLLIAILLCATVVASASTPYRETRYSFFLYPALIVLVIAGLSWLQTTLSPKLRLPGAVVPLAVLLAFLASEDFQPRHLMAIDSYQANFRVGYPDRVVAHYYERNDHKAPGDFLRQHAQPGDAIMITEVVLQPYLPWLDYVYLSIQDERFSNQACRQGTVERWTNVPLLYDEPAVIRALTTRDSGSTWIVVHKKARFWHAWEQSLVEHIGTPPVFTTPDDAFEIYRVEH
jgi:hypothetical protein